MKNKTGISTTAAKAPPSRTIKIFGVGNAGVSLLETIGGDEFIGANFLAVNTDASSLAASSATVKIHLETKLLRGLGSGGDPERGRALAEEQFATFKTACNEAEVVFIIAGLGGGAGTGISPVLARAAKESGALVFGFVTLPFLCEGNRRQQQARNGLDELKAVADGVISLPSQKIFKLIDENTSVVDTFRITGNLLAESICGVWRLLVRPGLIPIHFDDLRTLVRDRHSESAFASVESSGTARSREIVEKILAHPLLDEGRALAESDAVLVSLVGGTDLTMAEVNRIMEKISRHCERAQIIMGASVEEMFKGRLSATVIASKQNFQANAISPVAEGSNVIPVSDFSEQLVTRNSAPRPPSRCVPPPPSFTPEQREQLIAKHAGARGRKVNSKMRQAQLPLAIISKGRFDKSEPTIHKGEDLDLPTYVRRGIALN
jgi:cell division protein FtsZ